MNKRDAKLILQRMNDILQTYGFVTIGDYHDLLGYKVFKYTDDCYGWYSLRASKIKRVGLFRYVVKLETPTFIPSASRNNKD